MFVNWALRSVKDSLIQVDPLAAAIAYKSQRPAGSAALAAGPASISHTPLLLQFTPFGATAIGRGTIADDVLLIEGLCSFHKDTSHTYAEETLEMGRDLLDYHKLPRTQDTVIIFFLVS
jgi:hypothetical protein